MTTTVILRVCFSHGVAQEQPSISRFNSQSTGTTTLVGDNLVPPLASPYPFLDHKHEYSPLVLTGPDNKRWVDLEEVSPKLLKELRRQYALSPNLESSKPLAKGAAKVKAWARQSKRGIDIRLRRKLDDKHDEVTDIHLIPDFKPPIDPGYLELEAKPWLMHATGGELAGSEVFEMPDNSKIQELSSQEQPPSPRWPPSRTSTGSSIAETLPMYEPAFDSAWPESGAELSGSTHDEPGNSVESSGLHTRSTSESSILHTPRQSITTVDFSSLGRTGQEPDRTDDDSASHATRDETEPMVSIEDAGSPDEDKANREIREREPLVVDARVQALEASLSETQERLKQERQAKLEFERLLTSLRTQSTHEADEDPNAEIETRSAPLLAGLQVSNARSYETETDVEPVSPVERRTTRPGLRSKKFGTQSKRRKTNPLAKSTYQKSPGSPTEAKTERATEDANLLRRLTVPKRVSVKDDPEEIWSTLLRAQAKILGPEHPLTYQAKASLALSRMNDHLDCPDQVLLALRQSKVLASQTLGLVHPLVATFSANLEILERLTDKTSPGNSRVLDAQSMQPDEPPEQQPIILDPVSSSSPSSEMTAPLRAATTAQMMDGAARVSKPELPTITTTLLPSTKDPTPGPTDMDAWFNTWRPPHKPRSGFAVMCTLIFAAVTKSLIGGLQWLQRTYGPAPAVEEGKVRVRWTCSCGEPMYDDFEERRPGAARELEAYLNRRTHASGNTPTSPSSSLGSRAFTNSSLGGLPSTHTSWTSYTSVGKGSPSENKSPSVMRSYSGLPQFHPLQEPPWLLTCVNEDKHTPKLNHVDVAQHKISSDKDLALALRNLWTHVNRKWWKVLRLRGLTSIEFVQFEVHQNKFVDFRKCPDMPTAGSQDYSFEPSELLPPVGSNYLLHLFKHPEDYDGELITWLRAPKRNGQLRLGVGWGISLVEGFRPEMVWMCTSCFFALGSLIFGVVWAYKKHDIQGAFGVAAWVCTLAGLLFGYLQACLG